MSQNTLYYSHSGKTPALSIALTLLFGLIAALILGVVYGYAIYYIPFIYLNFFITLGFGALVGMAIGMGGKLGKARNPKFYSVIGLLVGLFAAYIGWVFYFYAGSGQSFLPYQLNELWTNMQFLTYTGSWSIFGWTPTGWQLYAIWLIEALMIVGTSTLIALGFVESTPFCENCETWIENDQVIEGFENIEDRESFKASLEQGQIEQVTQLEQAAKDSNSGTEIHLNNCTSCNKNHFLSIECVSITVDKDGKVDKASDRLMQHFILSNEQFSKIASLKQ